MATLWVASCGRAPAEKPVVPAVAAPTVVVAPAPAPAVPAPPVPLPEPVPSSPPPAIAPAIAAAMPDPSAELDTKGLPGWLARLRQDGVAEGISAATFDTALADFVPNPKVVGLDRAQPEVKTYYASYVHRRLTPQRIAEGRRAIAAQAPALAVAEASYGVPASVLVGIWGMETTYGSDMGSYDVVRSLTTLAFEGRRAALFRRELLAALKLLDRNLATRAQLVGSWAGAMGHPQFMPSSILELGVDADKDGKVDLRGSLPDVFASMGNYLKFNGWQAGLPWGQQVRVPEGFNSAALAEPVPATGCKRAFEKHSVMRSVAAWRADGVASNTPLPDDSVMMALVLPDGPGGIAFLTTANYRVILKYNCSNFYALSVLGLADAVR